MLHPSPPRFRRSRRAAVVVLVTVAALGATAAGAHPAAAACGVATFPPFNDNSVNAIALSGSIGTYNVNVCAATSEAGEPQHAGGPAQHSAWFTYPASRVHTLQINTYGSDFDTRLAVYRKSRTDRWVQIAANDDHAGGQTWSNLDAFIEPNALVYSGPVYIAVDGFNGAAGAARINWQVSLNPYGTVDKVTRALTADYLGRPPTQAEIDRGRIDLIPPRTYKEDIAVRILGSAGGFDTSGPIARLYTAYFDRLPDGGGLRFWVGQRRLGVPMTTISKKFAASSEFRTTYGPLTNTAFVDRVYGNVLKRPPDAAGRTYWVGRLNGGYARSAMMLFFSNSREFVDGTRDVMYAAVVFRMGLSDLTDVEIRSRAQNTRNDADLFGHLIHNPAYVIRAVNGIG